MQRDGDAIRVEGVSKQYLLYDRPADRLKQSIVPRIERALGRPPSQYYREFSALHDVTLHVGHGETVGIIGRNGSGKSTLLQIICGTLQPTAGSVQVNGRIAALLELGAGFNPDFTGRENVYLNATILGLARHEIDARFDDIAAFADIGDYLDQPVKTYSSGMYVRLAFASAINVDPDILVVDEALAVGDEAFQRKCFARIESIKDRGGTILFVSHGPQTIVQLCDRAVLIDRGELLLEGRPKTVVHQYQRLIHAQGTNADQVRAQIRKVAREGNEEIPEADETTAPNAVDGSDVVDANATHSADPADEWFDPSLVPSTTVVYDPIGGKISDGHVATEGQRRVNMLQQGREYYVCFRVTYDEETFAAGFGVMFKNQSGLALAGMRTGHLKAYHLPRLEAGSIVDVAIRFRCAFLPGVYFITLNASADRGGERVFVQRIVDALAVRVMSEETSTAVGYFDIDARLSTSRPGD